MSKGEVVGILEPNSLGPLLASMGSRDSRDIDGLLFVGRDIGKETWLDFSLENNFFCPISLHDH